MLAAFLSFALLITSALAQLDQAPARQSKRQSINLLTCVGATVGIQRVLGIDACLCLSLDLFGNPPADSSACASCGPNGAPSCSSSDLLSPSCGCVCGADAAYNSATQQCACVAGFENVGGTCKPVCPANSSRDVAGNCVCSSGLELFNNVCVNVCPGSSTRNAGGLCVCTAGLELVANLCVAVCPANAARDNAGVCQCLLPYLADSTSPLHCSLQASVRARSRRATINRRDFGAHRQPSEDGVTCNDPQQIVCQVAGHRDVHVCADPLTDLENCGGCSASGVGRDCLSIPHTLGVGCTAGRCEILSCRSGYVLDNVAQACVRSAL